MIHPFAGAAGRTPSYPVDSLSAGFVPRARTAAPAGQTWSGSGVWPSGRLSLIVFVRDGRRHLLACSHAVVAPMIPAHTSYVLDATMTEAVSSVLVPVD